MLACGSVGRVLVIKQEALGAILSTAQARYGDACLESQHREGGFGRTEGILTYHSEFWIRLHKMLL